MVLLGRRPSISSILRDLLLRPVVPTIEMLAAEFPPTPSTAAYLIFSDGNATLILEKDHHTAVVYQRNDFLVATNHDRVEENQDNAPDDDQNLHNLVGNEFLAESRSRKSCIRQAWREAVTQATGKDPGERDRQDGGDEDLGFCAEMEEVVEWISTWPITNECTHYAVVMDPKNGEVMWLKRFLEPIEDSGDGSFYVSSDDEQIHE